MYLRIFNNHLKENPCKNKGSYVTSSLIEKLPNGGIFAPVTKQK
jgi:hypothetical protein